jgi:hypothetical protein
MNGEQKILRIKIEDRWEASEFASSLNALDRLYCLRLGLELELEELSELEELYFRAPYPMRRSVRYLRQIGNRESLVSRGRVSLFALEQLEPKERLEVRRVIYGSPGIKDLAGIAEIIGHLKDFILRLIEHAVNCREKRLDNEKRELENEQLKIKVAREYVELARDLGYTKAQVRQLVVAVLKEQEPLTKLIADGKIRSADIVDEEKKV